MSDQTHDTTYSAESPLLDRIRAYLAWIEAPQFEPCPRCQGKGYHHGFGEHGADPDWCEDCGGPGEQATEPGTWSPDDLLREVLARQSVSPSPDVTGQPATGRCQLCGHSYADGSTVCNDENARGASSHFVCGGAVVPAVDTPRPISSPQQTPDALQQWWQDGSWVHFHPAASARAHSDVAAQALVQAHNSQIASVTQQTPDASRVFDQPVIDLPDRSRVRIERDELRLTVERLREMVERIVTDMRSTQCVAGQCSVEGPQDIQSLMAAAEAERCGRWADELDAALRVSVVPQDDTREKN